MLTELRYQVKIHTLSDKPREKISCKFSPFFFKFKTKTTSNMEMTSYVKARSNLCTLNDANTEKIVARPAFFCLSQKVPGKFSQEP
jgi:hypothetical protein